MTRTWMVRSEGGSLCDAFRERGLVAIGFHQISAHARPGVFHGISTAAAAARWPNLTLKKIPKMVLARCEWGHDDYNLNVANLPLVKPSPPAPLPQAGEGRKAKADQRTVNMFGGGEEA